MARATDTVDTREDLAAVPGLGALAEAVTTLRDADEITRFLRDLCTLPELEALAHRWQTVLLLDEGVPYVEIAARVPTSTATVTRVAQWLRHGTGGYRVALERVRRRERRRR
jgi:TrpR-related protein YerC/YecD